MLSHLPHYGAVFDTETHFGLHRLRVCSFGWQAKHVAAALTATRQTYAIMAAVVAFLAYLIFG
jgi:hypothetical protein